MPEKPPGLFSSPEKRNVILCLLLVAATLALYNPVNRHPFVNYDDDRYVTGNAHIQHGVNWDTISWAFSSTEQGNWHPLTWLSHALDYQLFHQNPAGHHFTSVLIHAANAILLFLFLMYATRRLGPSLFVAVLFALHPINVESVAWVAERKNVLCTFFFFAALIAYCWYARKPDWRRYLAFTGLFILGLMSKPMVITLPFVLLLLDYWPLGRMQGNPARALRHRHPLSKLVVEKIPLLALSAASAIITMQAQRAGGAVRSTAQFSLGVRLENAAVAYAMYLWKMIWPSHLAPIYPHPGDSLAGWQVGTSALLLLAVTGVVLNFRAKRYLLTGWLWFLGTLVPVIGLVQVGDQAMADRYAYIPLVGIFVMIAWGLADLADSKHIGLIVRVIPAACVLARPLFCHQPAAELLVEQLRSLDARARSDRQKFHRAGQSGRRTPVAGQTRRSLFTFPGRSRNQSARPHEPLQPGGLSSGTWTYWPKPSSKTIESSLLLRIPACWRQLTPISAPLIASSAKMKRPAPVMTRPCN